MTQFNYFAKFDNKKAIRTLSEHIKDSLFYFENNPNIKREIEILTNRYDIDFKLIYEAIKEAIIFHDLGKMTKEWQEATRNGKKANLSHSYISFTIYHSLIDEIELNIKSIIKNIISIAIATHHSLDYSGIFNSNTVKKYRFSKIEISEINTILSEFGYKIESYEKIVDFEEVKEKINDFLLEYEDEVLNGVKLSYLFKALYSFIRGKLREADVFGSIYMSEREYNFLDNSKAILNSTLFKPKEWQSEFLKSSSDYNFVKVDCGMGKSEATLFKAQELLKDKKIDRVIWTLPSRFLSASLYNRVKKNIKSEVGLYFSNVKFYKDREDEDISVYESFDKNFIRGVVFTTIDQLIYSFFNKNRNSNDMFANLLTSLIVIDEAHSYDKTISSAEDYLLVICEELKIPYIILTATKTKEMEVILNNKKATPYIKESELKKFNYKRVENSLFISNDKEYLINREIYKEIEAKVAKKSNLKMIVYCNTVTKVLLLREKLKERYRDFNIYAYHSEFPFCDKPKIENSIENIFNNEFDNLIYKSFNEFKPTIIILNQIGILGLDLSYVDFMISEIAPLEIIIQQSGRLNRKGENYIKDGFLYEHLIFGLNGDEKIEIPYFSKEFKSEAIEYLNRGFLALTKENLAQELMNLGFKKDNRAIFNLKSFFEHDTIFGDNYKDRNEILRKEELYKKEILTLYHHKKFLEDKNRDIREFVININKSRLDSSKIVGIYENYTIYEYGYNIEFSIEEMGEVDDEM